MGGWTPILRSSSIRERAWRALPRIEPRPDISFLQEGTLPPPDLGMDDEIALELLGPFASGFWSPSYKLREAGSLHGVSDHGYVGTARIDLADLSLSLVSIQVRTQSPG